MHATPAPLPAVPLSAAQPPQLHTLPPILGLETSGCNYTATAVATAAALAWVPWLQQLAALGPLDALLLQSQLAAAGRLQQPQPAQPADQVAKGEDTGLGDSEVAAAQIMLALKGA